MGTYSHSGIELYMHTYFFLVYSDRLKHKTAHHQSKLALKYSFTADMVKQ